MSYTIMKQKKLPPHFGEDKGMTKFELVELLILTIVAFVASAFVLWMIYEMTKAALT